MIAAVHPLLDVAQDVVEAVDVGGLLSHVLRQRVGVARVPGDIVQTGGSVAAVVFRGRPSPSSVLPLGLGR